MNEKLLKPILEAIRYLCHVKNWSTHGPADISAEVLADQLTELLIQLRAMLKEPTGEEREEMLAIIEDGIGELEDTLSLINTPSELKSKWMQRLRSMESIRAAIMVRKPSVTRQEIRRVVQENWEYATGTIIDAAACDIWEERTVEFLEHFGIEVTE